MAREIRPDMCNIRAMMQSTHEHGVLAFTHQSCLLEGLHYTLESVQGIVDNWMADSMETGHTVVSAYLCGAVDDEGSDIKGSMFGEGVIHNYYMVIGISFSNAEDLRKWNELVLSEGHEEVCKRVRRMGLKEENS